ncbi:uncharacterized protein LOC104438190 [Eucalyptus grandis]|uniref:uncharacterized protein LOC104438190 n=1 Tax=Eucalyptus grandis TaxID=71139 RepID=UPI00192E92E7|nr:uncharacterized protein LOC104438190 [Eucalyptus grandis]
MEVLRLRMSFAAAFALLSLLMAFVLLPRRRPKPGAISFERRSGGRSGNRVLADARGSGAHLHHPLKFLPSPPIFISDLSM